MNIRDYWNGLPTEPYRNTPKVWNQLLDLRVKTYRGFAELEKTKGFLQPEASLNTAMGQEMARILLFRTLEEIGESYLSDDPDHIKEEAVDAVNYLLALHALDPKTLDRERLVTALGYSLPGDSNWNLAMSREVIGEITVRVGGRLGDLFRNRAWMEHAQDTHFVGLSELMMTIRFVMSHLIGTCVDFDEFCRFYVAKDQVLQFRLRSKY